MDELQISKPYKHKVLGVWQRLPFLDLFAYQPWAPSARSRLRNIYDERREAGPRLLRIKPFLFT
jgi:hypothetical protein